MSTVLYRNAVLLLEGASLAGSLSDLMIEYAAELLDETTFGDNTRINKGGLKTGRIAGSGFFEGGSGEIEDVIFNRVGTDDIVLTVFPDGVTEGGTTTGMGFAMKGVLGEFTLGGQSVGDMLGVDFAAASRGIEA